MAALLLVLFTAAGGADPTVVDDSGREVRLEQPAERIVSLSPHITELLFAAGGGEKIVGTVRFSDHPEAARGIPRVGDTHNLDIERIIGLQPDLIVLWRSGIPAPVIETIEAIGSPVYHSEPRSLEAIATAIRELGRLAGTSTAAAKQSDRFMKKLSLLRKRFASGKPVRVFYQFWHRPIFTVNDDHLIDKVISLCGGSNIFADLSFLTPRVDREAVLKHDPEVIVASGEDETRPAWLDDWRKWPELDAVKNGRLYFIPPDLLLRHTPRILEGAEMMCKHIEKARQKVES